MAEPTFDYKNNEGDIPFFYRKELENEGKYKRIVVTSKKEDGT